MTSLQEFMDTPSASQNPCGCDRGCGKFLEPRVDGIRPTIEGREVNPDCYDKSLDEGIDEFGSVGFPRKILRAH